MFQKVTMARIETKSAEKQKIDTFWLFRSFKVHCMTRTWQRSGRKSHIQKKTVLLKLFGGNAAYGFGQMEKFEKLGQL